MSHKGLSEELGLTKSTVSRLVDQLTRRGWVRRSTGDGDARQRLVVLTPDNAQAAAAIATRRAARMVQVLDRIPERTGPGSWLPLDTLVEASREP